MLVALTLLEEYADSFQRDLTAEIKGHIKLGHFDFNDRYSLLEREVLVDLLFKSMKLNRPEDFMRRFKQALVDMNSQFREIRATRKKLFDWDITETGCDIDLELGQSYQEVDWDTVAA